MIPRPRIRFRAAAILVGVIAALTPVALLAYDAGTAVDGSRAIAQATATAAPKTGVPTATAATKAAAPAAPKTGNAGLLAETQRAGVVALLMAVTVGVVVGGRALASRRS